MHKFLRRQIAVTIREARALAKQSHGEICGLLVANGHVIELVRIRNRAKRRGGFNLDSRQVTAVQRAAKILGHEVVGTFHSHPVSDGKPGHTDIDGALDDSLMFIIDCIGREVKLWHISNGKARHRPFTAVDA